MRKKSLVVALAAVLMVAALALGTMAYFTDTAKATNTFTVGNLDIELAEPNFTANSKLLPGAEIAKDPTVTLKKGSEEAFIFLKLTMTDYIKGVLEPITINANWMPIAAGSSIYVYAPGGTPTKVAAAAADTVLPALFDKVKVKAALDNAAFTNFVASSDTIVIEAFAHQAMVNGTEAYATAKTAAEAHFNPTP